MSTPTGLTRRALLGGAVASAVAATAASASAQQLQNHLPPGMTPKAKGPHVFLDFDQTELDASYDQALWAPNQTAIALRNAQKSAATIIRLGPPRRLAYGPTAIERLDLYPTKRPSAPVHVFVHGGAWRRGRSADAAYMAETFVDAGAHFIAVDFQNVIDAGGNLMTMVDQVRRAVAWVYTNAATFGGDRDRLYLSGASSGAHLASVVLTTDWQKEFGLPRELVKGGMCCSGVYDLYPVSLSARRSYVTFGAATIAALSSQRHLDTLAAPVIVAYGTLETPEFQRQNREFAAAVKAAGKPVTLLIGDGYNHFEMHETQGNPYGLLGRAALGQMKLGPPV